MKGLLAFPKGLSESAGRRNVILICALLTAITVWILAGTRLATKMWFSPVPPGSFKVDAYSEILICSAILNWALPSGLILSCLAVWTSCKLRFAVLAAVALTVLFLLSSAASLCWWHYMDAAHGPTISLTRDNIWWAW